MFNILTVMQDKNSFSSITRLRHNSPITDKSLKISNYVQQITSFQPPIACPQHYHDNINYICIDCKFKCLCGTCLQQGSHRSHYVKNIEKGSKIVDRALNQALIRLRSKSDLLTNLKDYMKIRKSELFQQYKQYLQIFKINIDSIVLDLQERRKVITQTIQAYMEQVDKRVDNLIEEINQQSVSTLQLISLIELRTEKLKLDPVSACIFYQQKNTQIQNVISQSSSRFQFFRKRAPEVNWGVDLDIFDSIKDKIKSLTLETSDQQINLICNFLLNKLNLTKKPESKPEKFGAGNYYYCKTPKNMQLNRSKGNNFKSPSNFSKKQTQQGRLNSMPVSTSKQKTPLNKSPKKNKVEDGYKKTKKSKK